VKGLDGDIRDSVAAAAEGAAPAGYFDEFGSRVAARLEGEPMRGVDMSKGANGSRTDAPPPAALETGSRTTAKDEDSGLIEIKSMARSTKRRVTARLSTENEAQESLLASSRPSALRDVVLPEPGREQPAQAVTLAAAAPASESAPAAEAPAAKSGGSSWIALAAAVALLGGGAAAWYALRGKTDAGTGAVAKREAPAAGSNLGGAPSSPGAPGGQAAEAPGAVAPEMEPTPEPAPAPDPAPAAKSDAAAASKKPARDRNAKPDRTEGKPAREDKVVSEQADRSPPRPEGTDLDSLLDSAAGSEGKKDKPVEKKADEAPKPAAGKQSLSRSEIQNGMRAVKARVAACYEQFKVPGTVQVKVTISNTGVVTASDATGKFGNTDTGACVAKAVSMATFPEFSGPSMSLTYPFLLQ
jgi:hypothetical protein